MDFLAYLSLLVFLFPLFQEILGDNYVYFETAINRTFKTFIDFHNTGRLEDDTVAALLEMIIIPTDTAHFIFGKSSYLENNTYYQIMTDIGYFRIIWGYGFFGLLLHILFYFFMATLLLPNFLKPRLFYCCSLPLLHILMVYVMNMKEIFFMTKFSFQIFLLLYFFCVALFIRPREGGYASAS